MGGGIFFPQYKVELQDGELTYFAQTRGERKLDKFERSAEQWREFRQTLDELKVWDWQEMYRDPDIKDGTQWSLEIYWGDRKIKCKGSNSYPNGDGKANRGGEPTKEFEAYLKAMKKLLGGREFE